MPRLFSIKPGMSFKGRKFKGIRGWAGKPTHPPLTDVPIGAYTIAAAFDVISWVADGDVERDFFRAATFAFVAGLIASVPTALTGFWDWLKSTPKHTQAWRTANWHMAVMLSATTLVLVNVLIRISGWDDDATGLGLALFSVATIGVVAFGATYGGSLVYDYEFNVEQDNPEVWSPSETDKLPSTDDDPHPTT